MSDIKKRKHLTITVTVVCVIRKETFTKYSDIELCEETLYFLITFRNIDKTYLTIY